MRSLRVTLLLFVAVLGVAQTAPPAQQPPGAAPKPKSPFADYAGTWTSDFSGRPWLVLKLDLHGETVTGSIQHARGIQINDNGELKSVTEGFVRCCEQGNFSALAKEAKESSLPPKH